MEEPVTMNFAEPPKPGYPRQARWLFHGSLAVAFAAAGGALLVWPQWIAVDGTRAALAIQQERETEITDRLEVVRQLNERLRDWQRKDRRVFLPHEARRYPAVVRAVAEKQGA